MNVETVRRPTRSDVDRLQAFRRELVAELKEVILPAYIMQARDHQAGGVLGEIDVNGATVTEAPRSLVLNSRILWTFSRAYRVLGDPIYRDVADEARNVLLRWFYDRRYGGFYDQVNRQGAPLRSIKTTYGQGFAIYGLAEHYLAMAEETSLQVAMQTFQRLFTHCPGSSCCCPARNETLTMGLRERPSLRCE